MSRILFPRAMDSGLPPDLTMEIGGLTLTGTSVMARATAFAVGELGVTLDLGRLTAAVAGPGVVLLSHAHLDHLAAVLAYLNVRARFHRDDPLALFCPHEVAGPLLRALELMPGMESVHKRLRLADVIHGVSAGERVPLPHGWAVPFAADHTVPTLGWALHRDASERPDLVFAADGTIEPFRRDPHLLDGRVAIVECSLVERNRRIAARLASHAHLSDWVEVAPRITCDTLVLSHLPLMSRRALAAYVAPLADAFPGDLVPWIPDEPSSIAK